MMKITGLSHLFKWENLHNWWLTKYFFAPLYIFCLHYICVCTVNIYYVYINTHTCMYVFLKYLHAYIFIFFYITFYMIYKYVL